MAKIGDEKPLTLIAISDKTLKVTCLGFHVFLLKLEKTVLNKTTTLLLRIVTFNVPDPPF